jgi:autotransporter-associated beta strand protein
MPTLDSKWGHGVGSTGRKFSNLFAAKRASQRRSYFAVLLGSVVLSAFAANAQNAAWRPTPLSPDWNANGNWTPNSVPTGTATFDVSNTTSLRFSQLNTSVGTLQFNSLAPGYTFTVVHQCPSVNCGIQTVNVNGTGIVNNSGVKPTFSIQAGGSVVFQNSSSAGNATINTVDNVGLIFSNLVFVNSSTAATATIVNDTGLLNGGHTQFGTFFGTDTANAGSAHITNNFTAGTTFFANTSAMNATITNNDEGSLNFQGHSTAANAVITSKADGAIGFSEQSTAGNASITNSAKAFMQFGFEGIHPVIDTATAGNATIVNNGLITFYSSTTAGNATITTGNGGNVRFFEASTGGNAQFITNDGGTVDISNIRASGTTAGSIAGSGLYSLGSKRLTVGSNNLSTEVSGSINDGGFPAGGSGGSLVKVGTGTLTLSGANGYTGGTTISAGTLQLGNGGAAGSIVGNVLDNGIFAINRSDAFTFGARISGSGAFRQLGTGVTILTEINSYTGGTTITAGTLQLGNGGTLGSISGNVVNNSIFAIKHSNAFTFSGVISGSGAFQQLGTGVTTLTALQSYTGLTTITAGKLALTGAGDIASSSGVVTNGAFDISGVSGTGRSVQNLSGSGSVALGTKMLTLTNASGDFVGVIAGTGGLTLAAGKETLSGNNTYTGATNVNAGTLSMNGSIASSSLTTVNAGGTLGGNGIVGNTSINGGTLAPGNSIGTLAVQGNLVFTAAASYMVEVSPANADRTNVTGSATLGGATVKASFATGTYVAKQYTILNATGGVGGTFNTLANTDLPANFKSNLSYDSNNAYLNLALNFIPPPGSGLNVNQQNAANAIVGFFNSTGGIPLVFGGLTPAGLTQISGETATGSQQTTFNAMNQFMGVMTDPFIAGRGDPVASSSATPQFADEADAASAYASNGKARSKSERDAYAAVVRKAPVMADSFTQRWSVWAAGYGGSQTTDGNTALGSNNTRSSIGGVAVGADYRFSPNTLAGFALAGGGTSFSVNGLGSGRSDLFQAGAFVRHTVGAAYLTGALAYGWQDVTTDRTVTIAGADLLRAQFNGNAFSGRVEGGYRFVTPWMAVGLTPYAAGQFTTFDLPAYAEQAIAGANTFALSYGAKSVTASRSELGLRSDKSFAMQNGIFTLRGRAAWAHDFNPDRSIAATFQTLPGASFVVNGAAQAHDAALVTGAAEMKWLNGFSLAATFEGEFSDVTRSYAGKGVARYTW